MRREETIGTGSHTGFFSCTWDLLRDSGSSPPKQKDQKDKKGKSKQKQAQARQKKAEEDQKKENAKRLLKGASGEDQNRPTFNPKDKDGKKGKKKYVEDW